MWEMQMSGGNMNLHVSSKLRDDPICTLLLKVNFIKLKRVYHTGVFYSLLHEF